MGILSRIRNKLRSMGDDPAPTPPRPPAPSFEVQAPPPSSARGATPAREYVETLVGTNPVVLFMKGSPRSPMCGFSARAAGILDSTGVAYASFDVLEDPEVREEVKAFGNWPTIPQLYVGGELVGGSDIVAELHASGELAKLLADAVK